MKFLLYAAAYASLCCFPVNASAEWRNLTESWLHEVEGTSPQTNPYARSVNAIACDPNTGIVYLALPNEAGIWLSKDQGKSFQLADGEHYQGRCFGDFTPNLNYETGAVFFSALRSGYKKAPEDEDQTKLDPQPVFSCDRGETWQPSPVPNEKNDGKSIRNDGWTWVAILWDDCPPQTLFAKQHHTEGDLWVTQDGGANWKFIENHNSWHLGVIDANTLLIGKENEGIFRSMDAGDSWTKVADFFPATNIAVPYGDDLFWTHGGQVVRTRDGGAWQDYGKPIPEEIGSGPYFGRNAVEAMLVSQKHSVYITRDAGNSWEKVIDGSETPTRMWKTEYGWDPGNNIVYLSAMGDKGGVWKYQITE